MFCVCALTGYIPDVNCLSCISAVCVYVSKIENSAQIFTCGYTIFSGGSYCWQLLILFLVEVYGVESASRPLVCFGALIDTSIEGLTILLSI